MALERAESKQMTLAEIYDWIIKNIPYFADKGKALRQSLGAASICWWLFSSGFHLKFRGKFLLRDVALKTIIL